MVFYYACQVAACGKCFQTAKHLVSHLSLQHCDDKRLNGSCNIDSCCYHFNTAETFRKHVRTAHPIHWAGDCATEESDGVKCATDNESCESLDDQDSECQNAQNVWSTFLNDFARKLVF